MQRYPPICCVVVGGGQHFLNICLDDLSHNKFAAAAKKIVSKKIKQESTADKVKFLAAARDKTKVASAWLNKHTSKERPPGWKEKKPIFSNYSSAASSARCMTRRLLSSTIWGGCACQESGLMNECIIRQKGGQGKRLSKGHRLSLR